MRLVAAVGAFLLFAGACGDGDGSDAVAAPLFRTDCSEGSSDANLALDLRTETPPRTQGDVTWQLVVTNAGDEDAVLVFPSAQLGDVALSQDGDEIYRWSRERTFTQSLRCFTLEPGERARLDLAHDQLEINPGDYDLEATISAGDPSPTIKRTFTVEPR